MRDRYSYRNTPTKRRKSSLKRALKLGFVLVLLLGTYVAVAKNEEQPGSTLAETIVAPSRYDMSAVTLPPSGQAAIAINEESLNIHASNDQLWPMASITKVITAMAILEKAPIEPGEQGDIITLNQQDEDYYWDYAALLGTLTPITAGYEMTQYEILQTMLLASSNNMTDTLVDRYFSSKDEFVSYTNDMLVRLGFQHTRVADTTGFSPDSVSTPAEMIKVGKIALANPIIAEIVRQPNASPRVAGWIPNYNVLIDRPGVTGIKPGLTDESGHNLLFSSTAKNKDGEAVTIIGVVMGMFDRQEYSTSLNTILESAEEIVASQ